MINTVSFPGLGLEFELNRVAVSLFGHNIYWYGVIIAAGFLLAVFMSNSGGSWDNAKKYVESGHYGGKGSKNDKSAIVGDTIGDPFKDTSGPAINILIKLLSMVSIVFATVVVNFHVFG